MIKPKALKPGGTLGLVGISSPVQGPAEKFDRMLEMIEGLGFRVRVAPNCRKSYGYLAGSDAERAAGLNAMFRDDHVDAVVCMRGGYGAYRMLEGVDFATIRANPKPLVGYSDITALHAAIHRRCGMITFHGPMPATDWSSEDPFSWHALMRAVTDPAPLGRLDNPEGFEPLCVQPGEAEGPIVGGCLSLLAAGCGTPWQLDTTGKILLLEDVDECWYRIDSMLTQLRQAGMFDACAGVVLGGFTQCRDEYPDYALSFDQIVRDIVVPSGKPILGGMRIGHLTPKLTVPLGARARLNAAQRTLEILEGAVEA